MNSIVLTTVDGMEPGDAVAIARRLCKPGSEFQREVAAVLSGDGSSSTPIALWNRDGAVIAWACSHIWDGEQTLEMFCDERHRREGKASALAAVLAGSGTLDKSKPLAVFSVETCAIAARLGFSLVRRYVRNGAEWVRV